MTIITNENIHDAHALTKKHISQVFPIFHLIIRRFSRSTLWTWWAKYQLGAT